MSWFQFRIYFRLLDSRFVAASCWRFKIYQIYWKDQNVEHFFLLLLSFFFFTFFSLEWRTKVSPYKFQQCYCCSSSWTLENIEHHIPSKFLFQLYSYCCHFRYLFVLSLSSFSVTFYSYIYHLIFIYYFYHCSCNKNSQMAK